MILIISSVFPPEPVVSANIARDLAEKLSESHPVTVITPKPTRPLGFIHPRLEAEKGYHHIVLTSYTYPPSRLFGRLRESFSFGRNAAAFIKANKESIQCVVVHSWPLIGQFLIIRAIRKCHLPAVTHVVDIYPEALLGKIPVFERLFYKLLLPLDKYALKNSDAVITISPKMRDYLVKTRQLGDNKTEVVYNWQNEGIFQEYRDKKRNRQGNRPFTFMFLGNLGRTAALHVFINAYVKNSLPGTRLVFAGSGSQKEELMALAADHPGHPIEFWDAPMHKVPEIQDEANVLLLGLAKGAAKFALPSKLPAYMFSEKPILAAVEEETDTAAIVREASCGWIVPPEDTDRISIAMGRALLIPEAELLHLGKNGFTYAMENFTKQVNLSKFAQIVTSFTRKPDLP